jgi:hypothetical protein
VLKVGAQALLQLIVGNVIVVPVLDERASKLLAEPAGVTMCQRSTVRGRCIRDMSLG